MRFKLFHFLILVVLFSCTNNRDATGADAIYADYSITAEEGGDAATCLLRFYEGGQSSSGLLLEPPAAVFLDGVALQGDTAGRSGTYYEVRKPLDSFAGTHTIVYKNDHGKEYKEIFRFQPFSVTASINETISRSGFSLQLDGLGPAEPLRVLLTDTSFYTDDINEIETVKNGRLAISRAALQNVASGPVTLHLFKEEERPLKAAPPGGGKLSITYGLSRSFELVD